MTPLAIRPAVLPDADVTVDLWHRAGLTRPWNDPADDFRRGVTLDQSDVLLATDGDVVVGSVLVGDDGHRGWMYYLAVDETLQRHGVGRALVEAAERWLLAREQTRVRLMVRSENLGVVDFYTALGYEDQSSVVLGRTLPY